jgi:DNA-binding CsgD family transcriptional regulator
MTMGTLNDELIGGFYAAAAGEMTWPQALSPLLQDFEAWGVTLFGIDMQLGAVDFSFEAGDVKPEASIDYIRTWHRHDPRGAFMLQLPVGEWDSCHHHFDDDFVANSAFYQDFLIPYGGRWTSGGNVYRDDRINVVMSVHRGPASGPLADATLPVLQHLGVHMRKALGLWLARRQRDTRAMLGLEVVQRLSQPIAVVDGARRIIGMNPAAQTMLAESKVLRDVAGCLGARAAGCDADLLVALRSLRLAAQPDEPGLPERVFVRLGTPASGQQIGVCLVALRPATTMGAFGPEAMALVMFHDPEKSPQPDAFMISTMYALTPAETRVALALCAGDSIADIADTQGVSVHTVRSQVKAVLEKTGCSRQAELVGKLSTMPQLFGASSGTN